MGPRFWESSIKYEVVFVASGWSGSNPGGIQESARLSWSALRKQQAAALICYGDVNAAEEGCPPQRILVSRSSAMLIGKLWLHNWHARTVLFWHIGLLKILPFMRTARARVILFLHGIEAWKPLGRYSRILLQQVDLFLTNSEFTWKRFLEFVPECERKPYRVVSLGYGQPEEQVKEPDQPPAALMVGRMMRSEDYKGHRELIECWPHVLKRVPNAELWIAGDGNLRPELQRIADQRGLCQRIRFFGRISEEHKRLLLRQCRCLTMPSRGEGFGIVYLEAMRQGRPCLVSHCDAGREVVAPPLAGLDVDPQDSKALTDATCRLLNDGPEWRTWSSRARDRYEAHFTADHFQSRLLDAVLK